MESKSSTPRTARINNSVLATLEVMARDRHTTVSHLIAEGAALVACAGATS